MIEVLIADDHQLIREGLKKMISEYAVDIKVTREASDANELMESLAKKLPDIVLLDITMPGKNGLEVLKDLKVMYPKLPVLILSMHPEDRFAIRALKAGASGYFSKVNITEELVHAIRVIVTQKRRYISPAVADQLAQHIDSTGTKMLHEKLSDREYQVLCMIASGKKISDIAKTLSLSVQTIHTYRSRLKEKMDMKTDTELTKYAIQHNLID
jgi:two-component system, NarL family, invasion response regulator UvrY